MPFVFVVDADGTVTENMPIEQAIARAKEQELDLVEVSPKATPPVCKILDYGKYLYAEGKKEQKAKNFYPRKYPPSRQFEAKKQKNQCYYHINNLRIYEEIDLQI